MAVLLVERKKTIRDAGALGKDQPEITALTCGLGYLTDIWEIDRRAQHSGQNLPGTTVRQQYIQRSQTLFCAILCVAQLPNGFKLALELVHLAFRYCNGIPESGSEVVSKDLLEFHNRLDNVTLWVLENCLRANGDSDMLMRSVKNELGTGNADSELMRRFTIMRNEKEYVPADGGFFKKSTQYLESLK